MPSVSSPFLFYFVISALFVLLSASLPVSLLSLHSSVSTASN